MDLPPGALDLGPGPADPPARFAGAWPNGPAGPVALDTARDLAFYGAGGVVVTVDVTDPSAPALVSDAIQTRGVVAGLAPDVALSGGYAFLADGVAGLRISGWVGRPVARPRIRR